jgi:DNA-binding MarR family transcriptional regulator
MITQNSASLFMPAPLKPPKSVSVDKARPAPEIARRLKLDHGLGFLVRLLEIRATSLYERLTGQSEITPRQFGAMLTLYQHGRMTITQLSEHVRVDRSTLGEMINRMADRGLIRKEANDADRRSATIALTKMGETSLMTLVAGAAQLQEELLAPLPAEERAHFLRCMKLVAEPPAG